MPSRSRRTVAKIYDECDGSERKKAYKSTSLTLKSKGGKLGPEITSIAERFLNIEIGPSNFGMGIEIERALTMTSAMK